MSQIKSFNLCKLIFLAYLSFSFKFIILGVLSVGLHETHIHMNVTTVRVTLLTQEEERRKVGLMLGLARLLSVH